MHMQKLLYYYEKTICFKLLYLIHSCFELYKFLYENSERLENERKNTEYCIVRI